MDTKTVDHSETIAGLATIMGASNVISDVNEIDYYSQDYFRIGEQAVAVLRPENAAALAEAVQFATSRGLAIYPRGGGYSYTDGYLTTRKGVVLDMGGMNKVLEINEQDMFVTVEAGCTWSDLNKALAPHNLRTPFWGPFSGLRATVGGSISQGTVTWGSGKYGVSSMSVLDLDVITADGRTIKAGSAGQPGHLPFFRNYGPDLTGLFCGDCGALGIKASVTLRLIKRPNHALGLSFGFKSFAATVDAAAAVAREGFVADNIGLPASQVLDASKSANLVDDLKSLWKIGTTGSGPIDGAVRMAKVAIAGRGFLKKVEYTLHFIVEGPNRQAVEAQAAAVRAAVGDMGVEIPNTVPTALRADPFLEYDMLSPTGQRQLPPSTILPLSKMNAFHEAFMAALEQYASRMAPHNMAVTPAIVTIGTTGFLYEPIITWDDAPEEFHRRHTSDALLKKAGVNAANPAARELAEEVRGLMIELAFEHGGVHLQIGKVYPYLRDRNPVAVEALADIKRRVDPAGLMNPGALGLPV